MKKTQYQISKAILFQYLDSSNKKQISASKSKDYERMATYEDELGDLWTYLQINRPSTSPLHELVTIKPFGLIHSMAIHSLAAIKGVPGNKMNLQFGWKDDVVYENFISIKGEMYDYGHQKNAKSGLVYYFREHLQA